MTNKPSRTWTSKQAWKCSLVLIALSIGTNGWYRAVLHFYPTARQWYWSPAGLTFNALLQPTLWLAAVMWFARPRSLRDFLRDAGLIAKPKLSGWLAACAGLGIGFLMLYWGRKHPGPPNSNYRLLYQSGELVWFIEITRRVVLVPVYEELTMRGFLYRAFRTTYGQTVSTFLVLCVDGYFHRDAISHSLFWPAWWIAGGVILCQLRERTTTTWNCVLFHAAANAALFLRWQASVLGVILLFPYCARTTDDASPANAKGESRAV
jgi:membrane protease YdiL (CAAX protease family)